MKFQKITCSHCGADLNLDLDHLQAFCPYCGRKLLIDIDQLEVILSEKEKTKRREIMETTKRYAIDHEYEDRKNEREAKMMPWVALVIIVGLVIMFRLLMSL